MARIMIAGSGHRRATGALVKTLAEQHGHDAAVLDPLGDARELERQLAGADALVLVPLRGDVWRHTHQVTRDLAAAALAAATANGRPLPHFVLLSSFAVGHGIAHPLNRIDAALLPGRVAAEEVLTSGPLPYTIVRTTWLTDDPPGAHALTLTENPYADGMVARADVAAAMVAAIEHPGARDTVFALYNEPGEPSSDWAAAFAPLHRAAPREVLA
ncbi:NAD(P)H-binding protein [Kitasatospora mediocidica]|uniref:NAD(P)H-binding protein n=1 Tax=Kitasatospora mediocidica TaxID=58352 RepID=UPI00068BE165|nr:NAD(P)H-binding protein [Kitasatospora mediocidica]